MKIVAALITVAATSALAAGIAGCAISTVSPAAHQPNTPAASRATRQAASDRASARPSPAGKTAAAQAASMKSMSKWYSGATVVQAANVCGDVYRVYMDNVAVNSGTGSSSLDGDITKLQTAVAAALANPPPVAADALIWRRVLHEYSNAANAPTNSEFVEAVRTAKNAAWTWTPSFGGTLLVCLIR
jgi:hypothetical protein